MAICYHNLSYGNLGGSSSAHAVGYITGTFQVDKRTNVVRHYQNRQDVPDWGHFYPEDAPDWAKDVGTYWNAVDAHVGALIDKRYLHTKSHDFMKTSARTRQSVIIALPKELGLEDYRAFAKTLYEEVFHPRGCVVTYAIHHDEGNPHLHLMASLYQLEDGRLLDHIDRLMYTSGFRVAQREWIGQFFNPLLNEKGFHERINVQSYKEMGLEIESQLHEGSYSRQRASFGKDTRIALANELIREENKLKILKNTQAMIKLLAANYATFSEKKMYAFISKHMNGDALLTAHVFEQVKKDVVKISGYSRESNLYTTKAYQAQEEQAIRLSNALLSQKSPLFVEESLVDQYLAQQDEVALERGTHRMSDEQKNAVRLLCRDHQLSCLVGRAGTGKTTSLKAVVDLLRAQKLNVFGAAIASEAAQNLEHEAGVKSRTLDSYLYLFKEAKRLEKQREDPTLTPLDYATLSTQIAILKERCVEAKSVLIVDEAGMVGVEQFSALFALTIEQNLKLILVGDDRQFKSVNSGDLFRYLIEKSQAAGRQIVLSQNYRQAKVPWMSQVSMQFAEMNIMDSLTAYDERNLIHRYAREEDVLHQMAQAYLDVPSHETCAVLAYTQDLVDQLNLKIRKGLQDVGRLPQAETILNKKGYAVGDRFIFLKNGRQTTQKDFEEEGRFLSITGPYSKGMRVRNGMRGTLLSIEAVDGPLKGLQNDAPLHCLKVLVKEKGKDHVITFLTNTVTDFSHGYATTLHKSQGQTVDRTLLFITKHMDLQATYVAFTRHREHLHSYYLSCDFPTFHSLCDHLGRINVKDLIQDHLHLEHHPDVVEMVEGYKKMGLLISETLSVSSAQEKAAMPYLLEEKAFRAQLMLNDFSTYGSYLLSHGITKKQLELAAGLIERVMSQEERSIQATLHAYVDVSKLCRDMYDEMSKTHPSVYLNTHEQYDQLEALQERRGALAHLLQETPVLLRAYSKEIFKACHYGLKTVEKQAHAHVKGLARKAVLSRLSFEDQEQVQLYEAGVRYAREGRRLFMQNKAYDEGYQDLQKKIKPQKLLFKTMVPSERLAQQASIENAAAGVMSYFKDNPKQLHRVLSVIQHYDTLDEKDAQKRVEAANRFEDQLMIAKAAGLDEVKAVHDAQRLLHTFVSTSSYTFSGQAASTALAQMEAAASLVERMHQEEKAGGERGKSVTKAKIMHQVGYEGLVKIYTLARDAERLTFSALLSDQKRQGALIALIDYGKVKNASSRLWKLVKEEADVKNGVYEETKDYAAYQQASAQKDIEAFWAVQAYGLHTLRDLNDLMKEKNLSFHLDNLEREAERGRIHQACQVVKTPNARAHLKEEALETLRIARFLEREAQNNAEEDKPSRYVVGIIASYGLLHNDVDHGIKGGTSKANREALQLEWQNEWPFIDAYQKALRGFSKAYAALLKAHPDEGAKALTAHPLTPEALAVQNAIHHRNQAAFNLCQTTLFQTHDNSKIQRLWTSLKVSPQQFLQHSDAHESKQWVRLFQEEGDDHKKKERAVQLVEKMNLQFACQEFSTVRAAILEAGLDLKTFDALSCDVTKYPFLSKAQQDALQVYEKDVHKSRHFHEIAREQLKTLKTKGSNAAKHPSQGQQQAHISTVPIYPTYWQANMQASEKAYHLLQDQEVRQALSAYDAITMGRYAHQYETTLLLEAFKKAYAARNPIACLIAREMTHMLAFEALKDNGEGEKKLMKGTYGLVFAKDLTWRILETEAARVLDGPALRYQDVFDLHTTAGSSLSPHALELLRQTTFAPLYEQTLQQNGYGDVLKKPQRPYEPMTHAQFAQIMGQEPKVNEHTWRNQETLMKTVNEAKERQDQSHVKTTEKEKTSPSQQSTPSRESAIIPVEVSKLAKAFGGKTRQKTSPQKPSVNTPQRPFFKKERSFFQLSDDEKKQINNDYYEKFSDLVNYPSRAQDLLIRRLFQEAPKLTSRGVYRFSQGWEYHPEGIGGRSGKSVFKAWGETSDNLGIYDVAERKGFCSTYPEFMKYAGDLIGFRQADYFKERLAQIQAMRQATPSASIPSAPLQNQGQQAASLSFSEGQETDNFGIKKTSDKAKEKERFTPLAVVPLNRAQIYPAVLASAAKLYGQETMRFAYKNEKGELMGYVIRFEKDGQKSTIPFAFCAQDQGPSVWRYKRFHGGVPGTYPLYGLEKLNAQPDALILLVEGEKAADAAQKHFPDLAVLSWIGGTAGVQRINFKPLLGRDVMMWPDHDEAGFKAAEGVREKLQSLHTTMHLIDIPREKLPQKWDLADALPDNVSFEEVRALIHQGIAQLRANKAFNPSVFPVPQDEAQKLPDPLPLKTEEKERQDSAPLHNVEAKMMEKKVRLSETFKNSNGLFDRTIAFVDIEEVCERYHLKTLLKGKDAEQLTFMVAQSMNDLKNLTSWSSMLSLGKNGDDLQDQAILSTLMTTYAKGEKDLDHSFNAASMARGMGYRMARQCLENPKNFDLDQALKQAEQVEDLFKKQMNHSAAKSLQTYGHEEMEKTVKQYQHLCEAAFGQTLPREVIHHLKEKVEHYTRLTPKVTTVNTHQQLAHVLMTHELYKATNPHVQRDLTTHADVNKLFQDHTTYHALHGKMQREQIHDFTQLHQRSRGRGMSV